MRLIRHPLLRTLGGLLIGLAVLYSLTHLAPELAPAALWDRLKSSNATLLLLAALLYLIVLPVRAARWRLLAHSAGSTISLPATISLVARSWAVNVLLPLRAGDLFRIASSAHRLPRRVALGTIGAERIADLLSLAVVGSLALLVGGPGLDQIRLPLLIGGLLIGGGALGLLFIAKLAIAHGQKLERFSLTRLIEPILSALHLGEGRAVIATVFSFSALAWLLEAGALVLAAAAIGVAGVSPADLAIAALVGAMLASLPITPAGIGLVEGGLFGLLHLGYGIDQESAAGVILASRAVTLVPILTAGAVATLPIVAHRLLHGVRTLSR